MRIAISTDEDKGLSSAESQHFGCCPYYVLADLSEREVKSVRTVANPFYNQHQPVQVPEFIHRHNAEVIITGGMGWRAIGFFQQYGIEGVTGAAGTAAQALETYLDGGLKEAQACRESIEHAHHHGESWWPLLSDEVGLRSGKLDDVRSPTDSLQQRKVRHGLCGCKIM
jgi:predicted Fe-Mo cluster-binding NifX family protein